MARASAVLVLVLLLGAVPLAGCLGDEGAPAGGSQPPSPQPDEGQAVVTSPGNVSRLGLAVFEGIEPATVEPYIPAGMTPTDCIPPAVPDRVDVTVIVAERSYQAVPGEDVAQLALIGCAERPEGLAREDANEPPWVGLTGWLDGDAHARFLAGMGFPVQRATIAFEESPQGYSVAAERNGTTLLQGTFVRSPVGVPAFNETRCEPVRMDGRSIVEGTNGSLLALDWNKTEAVCPAEARLSWPEGSPVAELLGPAHAPDVTAVVDVEQARYWWRRLPSPG